MLFIAELRLFLFPVLFIAELRLFLLSVLFIAELRLFLFPVLFIAELRLFLFPVLFIAELRLLLFPVLFITELRSFLFSDVFLMTRFLEILIGSETFRCLNLFPIAMIKSPLVFFSTLSNLTLRAIRFISTSFDEGLNNVS